MDKQTTKVVCHNCWWEADWYDGILEAGCFSCGGELAIKEPQEQPGPAHEGPKDIDEETAEIEAIVEEINSGRMPDPRDSFGTVPISTVDIKKYQEQIAPYRPPSINKTADKPTVKMTIRLDMDVYNALWELHAETHKSYVSLINEWIRKGLAA